MPQIPREIIDEIRDSIDLVSYIEARGLRLKHQGNSVKCLCPFHNDKDTPSFSIKKNEQYFHCFGCEASGDIFTFIMMYDGKTFPEAVLAAAEFCGYPLPEDASVSKEEIEAYKTRQKLGEIYLQAAKYCHSVMPEDIRAHLRDHYGFRDDFIDQKLIGYDDGNLFTVLSEKYSKKELLMTGLFLVVNRNKIKDFFNTRTVFWYWRNGFPVYAIGRKTHYTEQLDEYEEYEQAKYKKLLTDKDYVSSEVQNDYLYNEEAFLRPFNRPKYVVITEGITDAMLAEQYGIPVLSPVTKSFRTEDIPKIKKICQNIGTVYIVNDSEKNQMGLKGALSTAKELVAAGINSWITFLPRPEGVDKVDLNNILQNPELQSEPKFREFLSENSKPYLEYLIDEANESKKRGESDRFYELIDEALLSTKRMSPLVQEGFFKTIANKTGIRIGVIRQQFQELLEKEEKSLEFKNKKDYYEDIINPVEENEATVLARKLYKYFLDRGALFFRCGDSSTSTDVTMVLDNVEYEIAAEENLFTMMLMNDFQQNYLDYNTRKMIFAFKSIAYKNATKIKKQTWLYMDKTRNAIYLSAGDRSKVIRIAPESISVVHNGQCDGIFVNVDDIVEPWEYIATINKYEVAKETVGTFVKYAPCSREDALMVLIAAMTIPLKRFVDTTPLIKMHGDSSAGKTQVGKMISILWYGKDVLGDLTDSSKFDRADKRPFMFLDNIEQIDSTNTELFLLYATSGGVREKRMQGSDTGTIYQRVDCIPILTAIQPFNKKELINRTIDVEASKNFHITLPDGSSPNMQAMLNELADKRNEFLSFWVSCIQEALISIDDFKDKRRIISKCFGNSVKSRLNNYFALMWHLGERVLKYYGFTKEQVKDLVFQWCTKQSEWGSFNDQSISANLYYLQLVVHKLRVDPYVIKNHVEAIEGDIEHNKTVSIIASASQLLTLFRHLAKESGERFMPGDSVQRFWTRFRNDIALIEEHGWRFQGNYKTIHGTGYHKLEYQVVQPKMYISEVSATKEESVLGQPTTLDGKTNWV